MFGKVSADRNVFMNGEIHYVRNGYDVWLNMYGDEIIEFDTVCMQFDTGIAFNRRDYPITANLPVCFECFE